MATKWLVSIDLIYALISLAHAVITVVLQAELPDPLDPPHLWKVSERFG